MNVRMNVHVTQNSNTQRQESSISIIKRTQPSHKQDLLGNVYSWSISYVLPDVVGISSWSGKSSSSNGTTGIIKVFASSSSKGNWESEGSAGLKCIQRYGVSISTGYPVTILKQDLVALSDWIIFLFSSIIRTETLLSI
jgi:hypothetical protein